MEKDNTKNISLQSCLENLRLELRLILSSI